MGGHGHNVEDLDCTTRISYALVTSVVAGSFFGAVQAAWFDAGKFVGGRKGASLAARRVASQVARKGGLFGAAGATFAMVDCWIQGTRDVHDVYNSALAGCAAGAVIGGKHGPGGAVRGCAAVGSLAAFVHLFDGDLGSAQIHVQGAHMSDIAAKAEQFKRDKRHEQ